MLTERRSPLSSRRQFDGLTGLRGVGALWVMSYHAADHHGIWGLDNGFLAVDLFFMLSGFVLSHAHQGFSFTLPGYLVFLRDRIARIFPLNWAALVLLLIAILIVPGVHKLSDGRYRAPGFVQSLFLVQSWGFSEPLVWNVPGWSLSTEWLASLCFPLFLIVSRRFRRPGVILAACAGCVLAFAAFLVVTHNPSPDVPGRAGVVRTFLEFMEGCLLYRLFRAGVAVPRAGLAAAAALLLVGLTSRGLGIVAVCSFPILVLASTGPSVLTRVMSTRPMQYLGRISFSIYALHWMVLQVINVTAERFGVTGWGLVPCYLAGLGMVIAMAEVSFRYLESPARRWIKRLPIPGAPAYPRQA